MKKIICFTILILISTFGTCLGTEAIFLGVLEQPQCKQNSGLRVRVLFAKIGDDWLPLADKKSAESFDLSSIIWTAVLNGQRIGSFQTTDPGFHSKYEWTYPRDKFLEVMVGQSFPNVINIENSFSGWCSPPTYRPIVVVSSPNFKDPAQWKPFSPESKYKQQLFFLRYSPRANLYTKLVYHQRTDSTYRQ